MRILINASNLGSGGATQVTDSFCQNLNLFREDYFIVVLTPLMKDIAEKIKHYANVKLYEYKIHNTLKTYLLARDEFLDDIIDKENIDVVFSVFAPTWWTPQNKPHLCGFALAHLVMPESPYFTSKPFFERLWLKLNNLIQIYFYRRSSQYFYTENALISARVQKLLRCKKVFTVTNYYNQIFDQPEKQVHKSLPDFDGITILTISNFYPHKNLPISIEVAQRLKIDYPNFNFRFVFTIDKAQFPCIPDDLKDCFLFIGNVDIVECPSLYEQCDIVFQPTLLECFTATYPEAMRMKKPIVTTDLDFAHGLCGNAAIYYEALSSVAAAAAIYKVAKDDSLRIKLINRGIIELEKFDTYLDRSNKLISLCKSLVENKM